MRLFGTAAIPTAISTVVDASVTATTAATISDAPRAFHAPPWDLAAYALARA